MEVQSVFVRIHEERGLSVKERRLSVGAGLSERALSGRFFCLFDTNAFFNFV